MLKIAHRGASAYAPENTLEAFANAQTLGANALEFDVHLSADGEVMVIHDDTLERTTSGRGKVNAHSADALHALGIPRLREVLTRFSPVMTCLIEVKAAEAALPAAAMVADFIQRNIAPAHHFILISFHGEWLQQIHARYPDLHLGLTPDNDQPFDNDFCARAAHSGYYSVNPCHDQLNETAVAYAKQLDLRVFTWTANSREAITRAWAIGADGVMSDYPDWL